MEEHQYIHFNRAMGIKITGKAHYEREMARRGLVPYEKALEMAEKHDKANPNKEYKLSAKATDIIKNLPRRTNGRVELGTVAINALKKIGLDYTRKYNGFDFNKMNVEQGGF